MKHYTHNVLADFYNHHYSKGKRHCPTIPSAKDVYQAMVENYDRQTNEVELLEACNSILECIRDHDDNCTLCVTKLKQAIAKAQGGGK